MEIFTHHICPQISRPKCIKFGNQGQFWKVQNLRSSKLSLVDQFDTFLAEIIEVKDVYYRMCKIFHLEHCKWNKLMLQISQWHCFLYLGWSLISTSRAGSHSRTAVNWNNPKFPNWKQKSFSRTQDLGNKIVIFCHN